MAILTAPFLPASRPTTAEGATTAVNDAAVLLSEVPLHVHTGVWPASMGAMPRIRVGQQEPERLSEIDEIPEMTEGERRLAREVELKHARLRYDLYK